MKDREGLREGRAGGRGTGGRGAPGISRAGAEGEGQVGRGGRCHPAQLALREAVRRRPGSVSPRCRGGGCGCAERCARGPERGKRGSAGDPSPWQNTAAFTPVTRRETRRGAEMKLPELPTKDAPVVCVSPSRPAPHHSPKPRLCLVFVGFSLCI